MNEMKDLYHYDENEFRAKMLNHEFEVPPMAWDDMSARLDDVGKAKPKAAATWWKSLYIGLGLSLATAATGNGSYSYATISNNLETDTVDQHLEQKQNKIAQNAKATLTNPQTSNSFRNIQDAPDIQVNDIEDKSNVLVDARQPSTVGESSSSSNSIADNTSKKAHLTSSTALNVVDINKQSSKTNDVTLRDEPQTSKGLPVKNNKTKVTYHYSISKLKSLEPNLNGGGNNGLNKGEGFSIGRVGHQWDSNWDVSVTGAATAKVHNANNRVSINPMVGAAVAYNFDGKNSIETGVQYKNLTIAEHPDAHTMYTNELDWQGSTSSQDIITPIRSLRNLQMLEMPIGYRATLHPKHSIHVGAKVAYLLTAEAYQLEGVNNPSMEDMELNRVNAGVYCGYELNMTEHIGLGIQYNLGLTNITAPTPDLILSEEYNGNTSIPSLGTDIPMSNGSRAILLDDKTVLKLPKRLRNTDLQLYLRYRF